MRRTVEFKLKSTNRKDIRKELINAFLQEEPGNGTGEECSHYIYNVDTLADGKRVFLKRPAWLNRGFDFEVHIEDTSFSLARKKTMPSHVNIVEDLQNKAAENEEEYQLVREIIERMYNCEDINDEEIRKLNFQSGHPIEAILKAIKWLFIEQDITYWNWSGRGMLYTRICDI